MFYTVLCHKTLLLIIMIGVEWVIMVKIDWGRVESETLMVLLARLWMSVGVVS